MKNYKTALVLLLAFLTALALPIQAAGDFSGKARVGWVFLDEVGNHSVHQGSFNLYDGAALSLENFSYRAPSGIRVNANLRNITLNNRNLAASVGKAGKFGLTVANSQYRRVYDFDGGSFTRRHRTRANVWVQPHRYVRLFGGFGYMGKHGTQVKMFEPNIDLTQNQVDYTQSDFNAGAEFKYQRYNLAVEFQGMTFSDDLVADNDRKSIRYQATASGPVPRYAMVHLYGGFQHYQSSITDRNDSLIANTAWGGVRYFAPYGINVKGSFIIDRARRTDDLVATDNLAFTARVGKDWRGYGGVAVGYGHRINDDYFNELNTDSYMLSAWGRPISKLLLRGEFGSDTKEVQTGRTLTGDEDRTRYRFSCRYELDQNGMDGFVRAKLSDRKIENDQIGSKADYMQTGLEVRLAMAEYGELQGSYSLFDGEYTNTGGVFEFKDHVLTGDLMTREYNKARLGLGGTYMRGKEDVDIESFTVRVTGIYTFMPNHQLEVRYTANNFDDLADPSPVYSRYYTANVVEISLARSF